MVQIWQNDYLISVQANIENAQYFAEKNSLENVVFIEVKE